MEFQHCDAYKVMEYKCRECGCSEFIWNSRNSVCPFAVNCQACKGTMEHEQWRKDQVRPDFKPAPGMRYFASFTKERAEEAAKRRIAQFDNTDFALIEGTDRYNEVFISLVHDFLHNECSVDLLKK